MNWSHASKTGTPGTASARTSNFAQLAETVFGVPSHRAPHGLIIFTAVCLLLTDGVLFAAEDERPVVDASKVAVEKVANAALPTFHIVGDSTVRSGGTGAGLWGWGERITPFFDTNKINVVNHAIGGRSARTFFTEGRWQKVADAIKPGDFVIVQFGHNDQGRIGDPANKDRADGRGVGDETVEDTKPDGAKEIVHTFGWYMAKFATDAKAHGATVILCSPIPHKQRWETGRDFENIAEWDSQVAKNNGALYLRSHDGHHRGLQKSRRAKRGDFFCRQRHAHDGHWRAIQRRAASLPD